MEESTETITLDDSSQQSPDEFESSSIIEIDKDEKEDNLISVIELDNSEVSEVAFVAPKPPTPVSTSSKVETTEDVSKEDGQIEDEEEPVFKIIFRDETVMK